MPDNIRKSIKVNDYESLAKEHFGTTDNFRVAGYILTDGEMLDFSGAHWLEGESPEYIAKWKKENANKRIYYRAYTWKSCGSEGSRF